MIAVPHQDEHVAQHALDDQPMDGPPMDGPPLDDQPVDGLAAWTQILNELERSLALRPDTPDYSFPAVDPQAQAAIGPMPAELRPWAAVLVERSQQRMVEIQAEMDRVADELSQLSQHTRAAVRGGWSASAGTDRSSSGLARAL
ncbi:hypothetical protein BH10ACT3_BH10ACT3_23010 [soil metagenome]